MRLLVIDGNSIVNRAFYGIKLLTTKDGQFTNGIYGFLNILLRLKEDCDPDHVAVAFDVHAPTFRHKMFDGYKAGRKGMPPELRSQMPLLKELLTLLGYRIVEQEGFEADDILGTLAAQCRGDDRCFLATGDRDALQLVSETTTVLLAATKMGRPVTTAYDPAKLMEEYGVAPRGMIEIKALMGDSSDNIPGVAGVGPKTAGTLIQKYGTIDEVYAQLETLDVTNNVREKLRAGKDSAYLSRTLGTICTDAPIDTDLSHYAVKTPDAPAAIRLLAKLEMFSMIEKFGLPDLPAVQAAAVETAQTALPLREERDLMGLLGKIKTAGKAYFVTDAAEDAVRTFFFAFDDELCYVPSDCFDFETFCKAFFAGSAEKYTADAKPLFRMALKNGWSLNRLKMDTTLAGYILNPSASAYDLPRLAEERSIPAPAVDCAAAVRPFAAAAAVLHPVSDRLLEELHENGQDMLFNDIELPLCEVLADMENTGFLVDRDAIAAYGETLQTQVDAISETIYAEARTRFNLNSPKQLGTVLFETLGLPAKKKTKSGYSTNAEVLEELAYDYPVVADILRYRTLSKLKSTYCDGLLKEIEPDGRIRSRLNQTETRTGRISSLEPNLQNIPVRSSEGKELRRFFTAGPGRVLVDADYSQIELRVLASIADDKAMIEAFNAGADIHTITASQVFGLPEHMVTPLMRSRAKAVNFGIVYGIGAFSLSKDIGVTRREADAYIKGYLHHYSGIDRYMHAVVETARTTGYAETIFHRRRYLPELTASNKMLQAFGERVARNMPVQGTAADIIKIAMVRVWRRLRSEFPAARLIMQVHDELIVECDDADCSAISALVREEMENAAGLRVRLVADVHSGTTWFDAKS
ncbi:MAG: DNA polymerase I [Clostridia bacterium]|nr:DNA polymerase I [Clostridia bacterium]